jgi:tetratricopeptide (TPR) repeat protein
MDRLRKARMLTLVVFFLLSSRLAAPAQTFPSQPPSDQELRKLAGEQDWNGIVQLLPPSESRTASEDFYLGLALAQLGRLSEAQNALLAGRRLAPGDPRFPVELAGIAFKQKNYPQTERLLRRALRLEPADAYANNFLATTYFLEGNLETALKYWNRAGKPHIANVLEDPTPRIAPALLDHAFAFSPAATLTLTQFLDTNARLRALGVFPQFHLDLDARAGGNFDMVFRGHELDGAGGSKLEALFLFFQGLPFQEVNPQYYDFRREAINFTSMVRWDAQKRRIFANLSGPFERSAKYRWDLAADLRGENWTIRNGFTGPAPVLAGFNMRHEMAAFDLASHASDRFGWSAGAEVSHRNFRTVDSGSILTPQMLASGYQLKQQAQFTSTLWRVPERRFTVTAGAASDAARLWSQPQQSFEKLTGSLGWHWFPRAQGDDYETSQQLRAGKTFGEPPFDELFILGLERDNDLPLRAHIGTRDGRKGSAPLGRNYFLENGELDKDLYANGLVKLQLGPFFDIGNIADPGTSLGSHNWLFDTGAQLKLRVFSTGVVFSYGKDLRTGNNAFYVTFLQ